MVKLRFLIISSFSRKLYMNSFFFTFKINSRKFGPFLLFFFRILSKWADNIIINNSKQKNHQQTNWKKTFFYDFKILKFLDIFFSITDEIIQGYHNRRTICKPYDFFAKVNVCLIRDKTHFKKTSGYLRCVLYIIDIFIKFSNKDCRIIIHLKMLLSVFSVIWLL